MNVHSAKLLEDAGWVEPLFSRRSIGNTFRRPIIRLPLSATDFIMLCAISSGVFTKDVKSKSSAKRRCCVRRRGKGTKDTYRSINMCGGWDHDGAYRAIGAEGSFETNAGSVAILEKLNSVFHKNPGEPGGQ